jgi:hypothetical protein
VTIAAPEPEEPPHEPLDYRAGVYYVLRFILVVAWFFAAYLFAIHLFVGTSNLFEPGVPVPLQVRIDRHRDIVLALDVLLAIQAGGCLTLWLLRRRPRAAAFLAGVTALLTLVTLGLRTPPAPEEPDRPEPIPAWTGCVAISGGRNTCPGG